MFKVQVWVWDLGVMLDLPQEFFILIRIHTQCSGMTQQRRVILIVTHEYRPARGARSS